MFSTLSIKIDRFIIVYFFDFLQLPICWASEIEVANYLLAIVNFANYAHLSFFSKRNFVLFVEAELSGRAVL